MRKPKNLLSQPENPCCLVNSFKLYISKLHPNCNAFFQNVNSDYKLPTKILYKNSPAIVNTIGNFLCSISEALSLSYMYPNHCIRGTTTTAMKHAGYSLQDFFKKVAKLNKFLHGRITIYQCLIGLVGLRPLYHQPTPRPMQSA